MKADPFDPTRRAFVRRACCAAVGGTGILSTLAQLRAIGALASARGPGSQAALSSDFKALVCLFLIGGNDANNVIVPYDNASYAAYAATRANIAVPQLSLLPITPKTYRDGRSWALHPSAPELQGLFTQGNLAVLANVGTLVQPTTLAEYASGASLPPQLFSHADQVLQWQSSVPDQPFTTGWGGRLADIVNAFNSNNQISMSISVAGTNSFQLGNTVSQYACSPNGVNLLKFPPVPNTNEAETGAKILSTAPQNLISAAFGAITQRAQSDGNLLSGVLSSAPALKTTFPPSQCGAQLSTVASLISVAPVLGLKRQIFFVGLNGWDLHAAQVAAHGPLLSEISSALSAFYAATVELGVAGQVTTFTASDFGRTYVPNSDGTDHGWGNHQFIMGGAVAGGDIYGAMPSLIVGGPDDTGQGRWLPSVSVDEYSATLASWFGVSNTDLPIVLPNIGRFATANLGFLG